MDSSKDVAVASEKDFRAYSFDLDLNSSFYLGSLDAGAALVNGDHVVYADRQVCFGYCEYQVYADRFNLSHYLRLFSYSYLMRMKGAAATQVPAFRIVVAAAAAAAALRRTRGCFQTFFSSRRLLLLLLRHQHCLPRLQPQKIVEVIAQRWKARTGLARQGARQQG